MVQAASKPVTFDEFIAWYPERSEHRYELHYGVIVEVPKPTGKHSQIAGFIAAELNFAIRLAKFPYFIPKECIVKPVEDELGYEPDVIVLDEPAITNESRWERESTITRGQSAKLVVEVASTNWSNDYAMKLEDYEAMGILEYWIADYAGLGGRRYIGSPKRPTLSAYTLINGEYQVKQFRANERIESSIFPTLQLTAEQIFRGST